MLKRNSGACKVGRTAIDAVVERRVQTSSTSSRNFKQRFLCSAFCELIVTLVNGLPQKITFPYKYSNKTSRTLCKFLSKVAAAKVTQDSTTIAFFRGGEEFI